MSEERFLSQKQKRILELILVFGLYIVVFDFVVGPIVDRIVPGPQEPMFASDPGEIDVPFASDFPDSVRGWLAVGTLVPFVILYIYYRPRLTGHSPVDYWKPMNPELVEARRE